MQDLKRIRSVTGSYGELQGLRKLPVALFVLVVSLIYFVWDPAPGNLDGLILIVPGVAAAWWLSRRIGRYYDAAFGQVQPIPRSRRDRIEAIVLALLAYGAFCLDTMALVPVSVLGMAMAVTMLYEWWKAGRFRTHYLVAAALFVVVALLPSIGVLSDVLIRRGGAWFILVLLGAIGVIVAILDHLLLARTLKPLPE